MLVDRSSDGDHCSTTSRSAAVERPTHAGRGGKGEALDSGGRACGTTVICAFIVLSDISPCPDPNDLNDS